MFEILIGSLLVALICVVLYWSALVSVVLYRDVKQERKEAVVDVPTPSAVVADVPETVKTVTTGDGFELWCALRSVPKIIKRPTVNKQRIATTVDERHVYVGGLDVTLGEDMGGCINVIKAIKGKPSDVRKFIAERYSQDMQEIVFQKWGL